MDLKPTVVKLLAIFLFFIAHTSSVIIRISDGVIEESFGKSREDVNYYYFLRIPYAEPPIGELRFRAPLVKKPWNNILDCTEYGPMCMQADKSGSKTASEDCLHLNVFTKNLPIDSKSLLKPVIVFIHGGAFNAGTAKNYGPEYLIDRDIVLVTFNYRLGAFGFMALETSDIPGNAAMKDQALVLKWIQKNIRHFGGDPDLVTVAGVTSGAHCATAHMVSPMSKGLFKNVIAMSGAITWQRKLKENNTNMVKKLAEKINCTTENINTMVQCLTDVRKLNNDESLTSKSIRL